MAYDPAVYNLEKYRTELQAMLSQDPSDDGWTSAQLNEWVNRAIKHLWRWLVKRDPGFHIVANEATVLMSSEIEDVGSYAIPTVLTPIGLLGDTPYPHVGESARRTNELPLRGWWMDGPYLYVKGVSAQGNELLNSRDFAADTAWTASGGVVGTEPVACLDRTVRTENVFTASQDNGTLYQTIDYSDDYRAFAIYLKRKTGSGVVQITLNGADWVTVVPSATRWTRFSAPGVVDAEDEYMVDDYVEDDYVAPVHVGIRLATAGDAVYIDAAQLSVPELGLFEYLTYPAKLTSDAATDDLPDELRDWIVPLAHGLALSKEEDQPGAAFLAQAALAQAFISTEFPRQVGAQVRYAERDLGSYSGFEA